MKYKLTIVSPWVGTGNGHQDPYRPQFCDDYTNAQTMELSVRPSPDYMANPNMGTLTATLVDWYRVVSSLSPAPILVGEHDPFLSHPSVISKVLELTADEILATIEADNDYLILSVEEVPDAAI